MHTSEIFYSLQGEGVYAGIPMVFIRLSGCSLLIHCQWCDTSYAWDANSGKEISVEEVVEERRKLLPHYESWTCITGGEPLAQEEELHLLVKALKKHSYLIEIETNGSIKKPYWWTLVDSWVADVKCPSSGVCGVSLVDDWFNTRPEDQVKFVVGTQEDLNFARKIITSRVAYSPVVLVSPVIPVGGNPAHLMYTSDIWRREVAEFCKELRVRYSLQLHKILWGDKRGV